jgi:hypothetical protein
MYAQVRQPLSVESLSYPFVIPSEADLSRRAVEGSAVSSFGLTQDDSQVPNGRLNLAQDVSLLLKVVVEEIGPVMASFELGLCDMAEQDRVARGSAEIC